MCLMLSVSSLVVGILTPLVAAQSESLSMRSEPDEDGGGGGGGGGDVHHKQDLVARTVLSFGQEMLSDVLWHSAN